MKRTTSLITLRQVTLASPGDVEFIRTTRNSFLGKDVYAEEHFIEAAEHQKWFAGLDSVRDFFFVILPQDAPAPVGFVGCYQKRAPANSAEISIYLTETDLSFLVPFHAMTLLLEFIFRELQLQRAYAAFFPRNERAIRFNAGFGFRRFDEKDGMIYTELTAAEYETSRDKLRKFLPESESPAAVDR